jgi:hypothetical protein
VRDIFWNKILKYKENSNPILLLDLWGEEIQKILRMETLLRVEQDGCVQQFTNSISNITEGLKCTESGDIGAYIIVTCISDFRRGSGFANRFIGYSLVVTTNNYKTFKITVIITHK